MVIVQVGHDDPALPRLMDHLKQQFPEITSLQYIINNKGNETFFDLPVRLHSGSEFITDSMGDLQFRIGPKSFYQTNGPQAHEMYKLVRELAALTGEEVVYDLYTGAGTIALFLASSTAEVIGIELVPEAIEDARINAEINQVSNAQFYAGDTKDIVGADIVDRHGHPDVIVTDPPRSGMHRDVVERLIEINPQRIVYVSCNPATQARDLGLMAEQYEIQSVHPVDMFPHTPHVECVIMLESRKYIKSFRP
jgi:23S rRNA (uracil1939-C5)-methyltransferase